MALDPEKLAQELQEAAAAEGFTSKPISEELGMPAFERKGSGPVVHLSAGIHGDEPASPLAALQFFKDNPSRDFHWIVSPLLNPTGHRLGTRENADKIDLNRDYQNFATREIQAQVRWLDSLPSPDLFVSFHEDYDGTGFYYYEIQNSGRASFSQSILPQVEPLLGLESGPEIDGSEATEPGLIFRAGMPEIDDEMDGLPEAIFSLQRGCKTSLTFETPTHAASLNLRIQGHLKALDAALSEFLEI